MGRSPASTSAVVSGRGCSSAVDGDRRPALAGDGHRHDLVIEQPGRDRCGSACWDRRAHASCSSRLIEYSLPQVLGGLDHPARHGVVAATGGDAGAGQAVHELDPVTADATAQAQRVVLDLRHRLRPRQPRRGGTPVATCITAYRMACSPEPQRRSTWTPGTLVPAGRRRARRRVRSPGPRRWGSTGRGSRRRRPPHPAPRGRPARAAVRSRGRWRSGIAKAPPNRPTGVRRGEQMTTSSRVMLASLGRGSRRANTHSGVTMTAKVWTAGMPGANLA